MREYPVWRLPGGQIGSYICPLIRPTMLPTIPPMLIEARSARNVKDLGSKQRT